MPDSTETLALGLQYYRAGYLSQAEQVYRQILQSDSANALALAYLGEVHMAQGRLAEATAVYQQALRVRPQFVEVYNQLGLAFARQGRTEEATANFHKALELKPDYPEAHNNLGVAFWQRGRLEEAIAYYSHALRLRPDYAEARNNLGIVFAHQQKLNEAVASYREALRFRPDYAEAHNNLGAALETLGKLDEAAASYREAVRLKPDSAGAYYNLGLLHLKAGRVQEAVPYFQQALVIKPDYAEAHKDLAVAWLLLGDFQQGWPEYEWRWHCHGMVRPHFYQPLWDGTPLRGRTILLHAEQGLGDTLQFIRYAPLVQQQGGKVLVVCQPPLLSLLDSCPGIDHLVAPGSPLPHFDVQAPLLSLPGIFRTTMATIPAQVPYLSADAELVERWRKLALALADQPGEDRARRSFKIGIAWQGNPEHKQDRHRSLQLARFEPLSRLPDVQLFSVQVGAGAEQLEDIGGRFRVTDLGRRFDSASFQDAAAAVTALDLILSVDSVMVHLAGALAIPVWVLLPYAPDSRWLLERDDSPWYPTMRLFRQKQPGDWEGVFNRALDALGKRCQQPAETVPDTFFPAGEEAYKAPSVDDLALGLQYHRAGYLPQAEQIYRQVLHSDYANADALAYLGELCMSQGRLAEATAAFQQVLELRPNFAEIYNNLGVLFAQQGKMDEAVRNFQRLLELRPDYPEAHNNLGIVLAHQEKLDDAISHYAQALRLKPDYAEAHNNLGIAFARQKRLSEAMDSYQQALRLKPDYAEAHNNLGTALEGLGHVEEALVSYGQAVRLKPDYVEAHNNLGASLDTLRHLEEALASYGEAVRLKPDYAEAHRNRALLWLLLGDFERGWPEYEWRWRCQGITMPSFSQPLWDGRPLEGRTILLHAEQGLGDTLHFIRYAPLVQQCGGRVLVQCPTPLFSLLSRCRGIDQVIAQGSALPDFDVHAPLLSLPGIFRTDLTTIPAQAPYLSADPQLMEYWRKQIASLSSQMEENGVKGSFNIGIAWQGNPQHRQDRQRSLPLERFQPLARLPGMRLFSLQVGPGAEQLRDKGDGFPVTDLGSRFDPASFQDAAAAVAALDLIISVDSALVHLAGALGVPVWVLLPFAADWRWLLGREDSPWYPTMRLFRQAVPGDWDGVFDRMVADLAKRVRQDVRCESRSALGKDER